MKLCDLHTHVLPGVDDGASTMEYALQMLKNAAASDVEQLVVTPHCNTLYGEGNFLTEELTSRFAQLQQAAADIPVHLMLGAEVLVSEQLPLYLKEGKIPTINGSHYLLTEFPAATTEAAFAQALQGILDAGYIPLVAHPERYAAVGKQPWMVEDWLQMGCHLQITGGSIIGEHGSTARRTAACLLQNGLVACVASDAHGVNHRSNMLLDVYDHLSVHYSKTYARCLMYDNPLCICQDNVL